MGSVGAPLLRTPDDKQDTFVRFRRDPFEGTHPKECGLSGQRQPRATREPARRIAKAPQRQECFWKWPREQYEPFMRRLHQAIYAPPVDLLPTTWLLPGTPRPALIPVADPSVREQQLPDYFAATWTWVIEQPAFLVLKDNPNFRHAWKAFQGHPRDLPDWGKPKDHRAACRFVYTVMLWLGAYRMARDGLFRRGLDAVDSKTREQAQGAVRRLLSLIEAGVEPRDVDEARELHTRLQRFNRELATPQRKAYVSAQHDDREWLSHLALLFLRDSGSVKPSVLAEVAQMVGYSVDPTILKRCIRWAKGATRGE